MAELFISHLMYVVFPGCHTSHQFDMRASRVKKKQGFTKLRCIKSEQQNMSGRWPRPLDQQQLSNLSQLHSGTEIHQTFLSVKKLYSYIGRKQKHTQRCTKLKCSGFIYYMLTLNGLLLFFVSQNIPIYFSSFSSSVRPFVDPSTRRTHSQFPSPSIELMQPCRASYVARYLQARARDRRTALKHAIV